MSRAVHPQARLIAACIDGYDVAIDASATARRTDYHDYGRHPERRLLGVVLFVPRPNRLASALAPTLSLFAGTMADLQITLRIERAWAQGSARSWTFWLAAIGGVALVGTAASGYDWNRRQLEVASHQLVLARASTTPSAPIATRASDFTQRLGAELPVARVVEELRRSCERTGVVLVAVQIRERAASPEQLGRAELVVTLRGSYADSKHVLKDAIDRYSARLTVQRMRMRRLQSPADVETTVVLSLWSAPPTPDAAMTTVAAGRP